MERPGKGQQDSGRLVGEVPRLLAGDLQQGPRRQPARLPEVRASLPASAPLDRLRMLFDGGRFVEHDEGLASADPCSSSTRSRTPSGCERRARRPACKDAVISATGDIDGQPCVVAAMEYAFIGGSMGVVVGEKITRGHRARHRRRAARRHRLLLGRRAHDGRRALADADGQDQRRARAARPRAAALHLGAHRSDHRRRHGELRDARRPEHRRAEGADRLRRPARHRADDPAEAAGGLPAQRVPARARDDRHGRRSPRAEGDDRPRAALHVRRRPRLAPPAEAHRPPSPRASGERPYRHGATRAPG